MASGTFPGNINLIRTSPYGPTVREAIASAIEQADSHSDTKITQIHNEVQNEVRMSVTKIANSDDEYLLTITNPS